ncbi:MAG TPA: DUF4956 domain-containing protein [Cyclobacteriaceae bacterium]
MFEIFPDHPVYEYPELVNITYSLVWSFILASIIAITHKLTFTGDHYPKNFFQALMLGAVVTAMVMMAVGDSLARGLGVFGAMAIIRFRTRIDDPRNVLFLFAALSSGLGVGVYGFTISFVGTIIFCGIAFILHYSPFRSFTLSNSVYFTLSEPQDLATVVEVLSKNCADFRVASVSLNKDKNMRYKYTVALRQHVHINEFILELKFIPGLSQVKIELNETPVIDL